MIKAFDCRTSDPVLRVCEAATCRNGRGHYLFENDLLCLGILLINFGPYHPKTCGNFERFYRTLETEVHRHDSLGCSITYYNERQLHWSLDIGNRRMPLKAFRDKTAHETIWADNPNWMVVDIHGWVTH